MWVARTSVCIKRGGVIVKSLIFYVIFVNKVNPIKLKNW